LGGARDDKIYLEDAQLLGSLGGRLIFDGDANIQENSETVKYVAADHDAALKTAPFVFIGTGPHKTFKDAGGHTFNYADQVKDRILLKAQDPDNPSDTILWVYAVVLQSNGTLYEDMVQERGVQEYGVQEFGVQKTTLENNITKVLYYDANGAES